MTLTRPHSFIIWRNFGVHVSSLTLQIQQVMLVPVFVNSLSWGQPSNAILLRLLISSMICAQFPVLCVYCIVFILYFAYLFCPVFHMLPSVLWYCWLGIRKSIRPVKIEWWGIGVLICLEQGADCLHMVQLMPCLQCFDTVCWAAGRASGL